MVFKILDFILKTIITKSYILVAVALLVGITTFIVTHKSTKIYQKALSKRVKKIKDLKNSYENSYVEAETKKLLKKYNKALKRLDRKIKSILRYNGKRIYIPSDLLNDYSNLALSGNEPFTFKDRLNSIINDDKRKIKTEVVETYKGKKVAKEKTGANETVKYTTLDEKEMAKFNNFNEKAKESNPETLIYQPKKEENTLEK